MLLNTTQASQISTAAPDETETEAVVGGVRRQHSEAHGFLAASILALKQQLLILELPE